MEKFLIAACSYRRRVRSPLSCVFFFFFPANELPGPAHEAPGSPFPSDPAQLMMARYIARPRILLLFLALLSVTSLFAALPIAAILDIPSVSTASIALVGDHMAVGIREAFHRRCTPCPCLIFAFFDFSTPPHSRKFISTHIQFSPRQSWSAGQSISIRDSSTFANTQSVQNICTCHPSQFLDF